MDKEVTEMRDRIAALEWALYQLLHVLEGEQGFPLGAFHQAMSGSLERAAAHGVLSESEQVAVRNLADGLAEIPADFPAYLKQLRRAWPPGAPGK